jgi:flagellar biosynthetic protein FliR
LPGAVDVLAVLIPEQVGTTGADSFAGIPISLATVSSFVLVLARTSSWVMTAPIFVRQGASMARLAIAIGLAIFITPLIPTATVPNDVTTYMLTAAMQVGFGLMLGFLQGLMLTAVETAGQLADLTGGLSFGAQIDPVTGTQSSVFTRLATMGALAVLFVTDGAQQIVAGFVRSFSAIPLDKGVHLVPSGAGAIGHLLSQVVASALEIAAPLIGVVFITDVGLALLSRFVPAANINSVGLSVKALVALSAFGTFLMLLPNEISNLVSPMGNVVNSVIS